LESIHYLRNVRVKEKSVDWFHVGGSEYNYDDKILEKHSNEYEN